MSESKEITDPEERVKNETEVVPLSVGLPVFFLVIIGFGYGIYWIHGYLQDEQKLPVQNIVFSGELTMLNTQVLERQIRQKLTASFFALDVNDVHALIESNAWVFSASVRKRWPSQLNIHIQEQQAVAIWNDDLLLNKYGDTFDGLSELGQDSEKEQLRAELFASFAQLYGPGGSEKTALTGYTNMQRLLNTSGHIIDQLVLSERFAWQTKLQSGIILKLGRQEYINRLQRFIDVYPTLMERHSNIKYVDLRYDTGLAVGFFDESELEKLKENT